MEVEVRNALVIGASGGIGGAVAQALRADGVEVTGLSRKADQFDVTDPPTIESALTAANGPFDLVFVATGILAPIGSRPEKSLTEIDAAMLAEVLAVNAIGPALILRHVPRLLPKERRSVVAVLTARVGSIGDNALGGWYAYRASKAAANQIVRTSAIEIARRFPNAVVVALHPGTVATPFTEAYPGHEKVPPDLAAERLLGVIEKLTPSDTGRFLDWAGKEVPW
jgi:NAD(P)-dependent dehydrogenase (short-subunit alcohol dehydrogenase family)